MNTSEFEKSSRRSLAFSSVTLIVTIVLIIVNILISVIPTKFTLLDATSGKRLSVSEATKEYLAELSEPVTLWILNSDGTDKRFETFVGRYAQYGKNVTLKYVNTESDPAFLTSRGYTESVSAYSVLVESAKRSRIISYNDFYYYQNATYGEMSPEVYNYYLQYLYQYLLQDSSYNSQYASVYSSLVNDSQLYFRGESKITVSIEYVLLPFVPHAYYVTGHGESDMKSTNIGSMFTSYGVEYEAFDISAASEIPVDANCIIINSPQSDYSDSETALLLDYLKDGGSMTLLTNAANTSMPNLMSLMSYYGVSPSTAVVAVGEGDEKNTTISVTVNEDHDSLYSASSYPPSITDANAIITADDKRKSVLVTSLLTTESSAYIDDDIKENGPFAITVSVEEVTEGGTTEIVWFTGSDSFSDKSSSNNLSFVYLAVVWMSQSYHSVLPDITPIPNSSSLTVSNPAIFGVILIGVIPLASLITGIIIFRKRRKA